MCGDLTWFSEYEDFPTPKKVELANGKTALAKGTGKIELEAFLQNQWKPINLFEVQYVKGAANLFSETFWPKKASPLYATPRRPDSGKIIEARNVNFHEEDDPVFKSKEDDAKPQEPPSEDSGDDDSDPSYSVTEDEDGHLSYSVTEDDEDILNLHADGSITDEGEKNEDPRPGTSSSSDKNKL
ncbi:unnamed protein product, partial [Allacma fusca]